MKVIYLEEWQNDRVSLDHLFCAEEVSLNSVIKKRNDNTGTNGNNQADLCIMLDRREIRQHDEQVTVN